LTTQKPGHGGLRPGRVVRVFDPWRSPLCTCPPKYSLQPYTGCSHFCQYCYATAYIGRRPSTVKKRYLERLLYDVKHVIDPRYHIDISTSSDPYPPEEATHGLTRLTLGVLVRHGLRALIVTKGSLVVRDLDVISRGSIAVMMTITTLDAQLASRLEPRASPPRDRVRALRELARAGVPVGLRLDPVIPMVNDDPHMVREVLEAAYDAGVRFVVTSTYKARPDNLKRMSEAFPEIASKLRRIYVEEGVWMHGYWYLRPKARRQLLEIVVREAAKLGMQFATCREGFSDLNRAPSCDGSHLIPRRS
jgi:DNA repair photolyase